MDSDPIATATFVVLNLLMVVLPLVVGGLLLSRGRGKCRQAQIAFLTWMAQQDHGHPSELVDVPPGLVAPTYADPQPAWPMTAMPPQVRAAGRALRVWGWILIGFGALYILGTFATAGA